MQRKKGGIFYLSLCQFYIFIFAHPILNFKTLIAFIMKKLTLFLALCFSTLFLGSMAQSPTPASKQAEKVLLKGGTFHIGDGNLLENGALLMENGKIIRVGKANEFPNEKAKTLDCAGMHIFPGLILPNTILGLTEVDAVRATLDFQESGTLNPNTRSLIAYNAESEIIPTVRSNGVLLAQVTPRGQLLAGTSSIVQLDAWNWDDAAYKIDDGIHLYYPPRFIKSGWWAERGSTDPNPQREKQLKDLDKLFDDAAFYHRNTEKQETNLMLASMKGLFTGTQKLFIHSENSKDVMESVIWAKGKGVKEVVVNSAAGVLANLDFLKGQQIPVVVKCIHNLPPNPESDIDFPANLPKKLFDAGILYCLDNSVGMEAMGSRNLPFLAGSSMAFGLGLEEALQSVTLNAAKILGIDKRTGSLEVGKDANLIVSKGNILDARTNQITKAYIQGREIDLNNRHKELNKKFSKKLGVESSE